MAEQNLIREVAVKQDDGTMGSYTKIGSTFSEVVDTRSGNGNYSLAQFFDNYLDFMNNTTFVYTGTDTPSNSHVGFWIDTSKTNHDSYGEK